MEPASATRRPPVPRRHEVNACTTMRRRGECPARRLGPSGRWRVEGLAAIGGRNATDPVAGELDTRHVPRSYRDLGLVKPIAEATVSAGPVVVRRGRSSNRRWRW